MLAQDTQGGPRTALRQFQIAFAWWAAELRAIVPIEILALFDSTSGAFEIRIAEEEVVVSKRIGAKSRTMARIPRDGLTPQVLAKTLPQDPLWLAWLADPIVLRLPATDALERTLRFPDAARGNLPSIMRHEVARQSPVDTKSIYYVYRGMPETEGLRVDLSIIRRNIVDDALALCRAAGVEPNVITLADDDALPDGNNFPIAATAADALRRRVRLVPRLAAAAAVMAAIFVGAAFLRGQWVLDDLNDRIVTAQTSAANVERLRSQMAASVKGASLLSQEKRAPSTVQVLAEVSSVLPNGAWLYEFEISQGEVRIHGFSRAAAALIALFDASPYFQSAQFRSPLMQGPSGDLERFDMSFKLKSVT